MAELIELEVSDDETAYFQVLERKTRRGESDEEEKKLKKFRSLLKVVKPIAEAFVEELGDLSVKTKEMEIEFGLSITADAKLFVVNVEGQSTFKVRLKWA